MKRPVKYRGISQESKEWVYGAAVTTELGAGRTWIGTVAYVHGSRNQYVTINSVEVDPETLGEFTGLLDRNGKEVFEGDIITGIIVRLSGDEKIFGYIEYDNSSAKYVVKFRSDRGWLLSKGLGYFHEIIVNGNIYENPELLK